MGSAAPPGKSPKGPRRVRTPPRQVHFEGGNNSEGFQTTTAADQAAANSRATASSTEATGDRAEPAIPVNNGPGSSTTYTQPSSYPALGLPPGTQQQGYGPGPWFVSANPGQSVSQPPPGRQQVHQPPPFYHCQGGIFIPHPPARYTMAANYQNAAPPRQGVNFQPPVPDTTNGPMYHTYIPRFDNGIVPPGQHVRGGPPGVQQQPLAGAMPPQQPVYVAQPQPTFVQQQPVMVNGAVPAPGGYFIPNQPTGGFVGGAPGGPGGPPGFGGPPINAGNTGPVPEVAGVGRTAGEEQLRQLNFAHANRLFEAQEFKPADDDPSRFYYVRELDGNWTQRNRFSIDHMGDCRWYVTDEGWFYAVRLPN